MDPIQIRDELRRYLKSDSANLAQIERSTSLNRSWLSKFKRGEIKNPTIKQLSTLHRYRESTRGAIA